MSRLVYNSNPKHKRGACGEGPPRWFPSRDALCPDDLSTTVAQAILEDSVEDADPAHPGGRARFALYDGEFYKAYRTATRETEDGPEEIWHGYPVRKALVPRQIPARVLRKFLGLGRLSRVEYCKLLGSAK